MKVAILYDAGSGEWDPKDVAAVLENVREVQTCLRRGGYETTLVPVVLGDVRWMSRVQRADLVFNLCEGVNGHALFEDYVVAALELTRIPFTGCRSWPVTICHRKHIANGILARHGIPVPQFTLAQGNSAPAGLKLPVIVKPSGEDASVGIDAGSVCTTKKSLRERLAKMSEQWEDVLLQEYVEGREFNVGFIGREAMPVSEIRFEGMPEGSWPILTYAAKWHTGSEEDLATIPVCPAQVGSDLSKRMVEIAQTAWELMSDGEGYGRVDLRVDAEGQPWVIEVNPNADLSSDAGLARMAKARGWDYRTLILKVVDEAMARANLVSAADSLMGKVMA